MENHSFDQMLGCLKDDYPDLEGIDVKSPSPRLTWTGRQQGLSGPTDVAADRARPQTRMPVCTGRSGRQFGFVTDFQYIPAFVFGVELDLLHVRRGLKDLVAFQVQLNRGEGDLTSIPSKSG